MEPPSVSMFVKRENQYTRNSGSLLKTGGFHLIFGYFYHFDDFPCVDVSRLHLILHISNTDCAGFFSIIEYYTNDTKSVPDPLCVILKKIYLQLQKLVFCRK